LIATQSEWKQNFLPFPWSGLWSTRNFFLEQSKYLEITQNRYHFKSIFSNIADIPH